MMWYYGAVDGYNFDTTCKNEVTIFAGYDCVALEYRI